jgi:hypothetical protein
MDVWRSHGGGLVSQLVHQMGSVDDKSDIGSSSVRSSVDRPPLLLADRMMRAGRMSFTSKCHSPTRPPRPCDHHVFVKRSNDAALFQFTAAAICRDDDGNEVGGHRTTPPVGSTAFFPSITAEHHSARPARCLLLRTAPSPASGPHHPFRGRATRRGLGWW